MIHYDDLLCFILEGGDVSSQVTTLLLIMMHVYVYVHCTGHQR